jgi:phage shock protein PspC (stress-responsive transcriptional regulator)
MTEHDPLPPARPDGGPESDAEPAASQQPARDAEATPAGPGGAGSPGGPGEPSGPPREPGGATALGGSDGASPPPPPPPRRLQRSKQRRVLAGVAGGLGEYTGVDPVLFRVLFAVLTVFGGAGILLYVVGWLFLPDEDQPTSPAEHLVGRGGNRGSDTVQAVLLAVAALILTGLLLRGDAGDIVLILLVVGGTILLVRRLDERRGDVAPPAAPPPTGYQPYQPYDPQPYDPYRLPETGTATAATDMLPYPPPAAPVPERRRRRSPLGWITLSVLLLVLGVTAALDAAGVVDPMPRHYLALALGVVGLGLIVGAWRGRARGLVWLGIPLTVALVAVSTAEVRLDGGVGDRHYRPLSVADVQSRYRVGVGNLELDLTDVSFAERAVTTSVSAGIGNVRVVVPANVDVRAVGKAGLGEADVFGEEASGTASERTVVNDGPDGSGGGTLNLLLEVGIGRVEVDRASA